MVYAFLASGVGLLESNVLMKLTIVLIHVGFDRSACERVSQPPASFGGEDLPLRRNFGETCRGIQAE